MRHLTYDRIVSEGYRAVYTGRNEIGFRQAVLGDLVHGTYSNLLSHAPMFGTYAASAGPRDGRIARRKGMDSA